MAKLQVPLVVCRRGAEIQAIQRVLSSVNYLGHPWLGRNNVLNFVLTVIIMLTSRRESLRSVLSAPFAGLMVLGWLVVWAQPGD